MPLAWEQYWCMLVWRPISIEEGHDVHSHDPHVEGLGVLEIVVPDLLNGFAEEFGNTPLGCLVTGVVIKTGLVGRFRFGADDGRGVIVDLRRRWGDVMDGTRWHPHGLWCTLQDP